MPERDVVIYTQPECAGCQREKKFLTQKGIDFTEKNIQEDEQALEELLESGAQGTPTTLIDGKAIVGFDRQKLAEKLGL